MTLGTILKELILRFSLQSIIETSEQIYGPPLPPAPAASPLARSNSTGGSDSIVRYLLPVDDAVPSVARSNAAPKRLLVDLMTDFHQVANKRQFRSRVMPYDMPFRAEMRLRMQAVRRGVQTVIFVADKGIPPLKLREAANRAKRAKLAQERKEAKAAAAAAAEAEREATALASVSVTDEEIDRFLYDPPPLETLDGQPVPEESVPLSQPGSPPAAALALEFQPAPYDDRCMVVQGGILRFEQSVVDNKDPDSNRVVAFEREINFRWVLASRRLRAQYMLCWVRDLVAFSRHLMHAKYNNEYCSVLFIVDCKFEGELETYDVHKRATVSTSSGHFHVRNGKLWTDTSKSTDRYLEADHALGAWCSYYMSHPYNNPKDPATLQHCVLYSVDGDLLIISLLAVFAHRYYVSGMYRRAAGDDAKLMQPSGKASSDSNPNCGFLGSPLPGSGYRRATEPHLVCCLYHRSPAAAKIIEVNDMLSTMMNQGMAPMLVAFIAAVTHNDYIDKNRISRGIGAATIWAKLLALVREQSKWMIYFEEMHELCDEKAFYSTFGTMFGKSLAPLNETASDEERAEVHATLVQILREWRTCGLPPRARRLH